ncbi:MAG: DUF2628 domain-containing protein [Alphaproteobacteria bacterium]|nr:DUF2628 domain-containing protein [Alphaproteobacteria bacterium]
MQGRFSRIFELFNQRNTEYYQQVFDRLEKENKITFNFAAGFFPILWLVYRKMYGWAILFVLAGFGIRKVLYTLYTSSSSRNVGYIFLLISVVGFGFFGNTLYYKHVKSKIAKGYAEIANYNSIDPVCGIFLVIIKNLVILMLPAALAGTHEKRLLLTAVVVFIIAVSWTIDYESGEPIKVTKESVNQYLKKSSSKYLAVYFITMFLTYELFICSWSALQVHKSYARLRQSNKNSSVEKITKTVPENAPINFSKKNIYLLLDESN